MVTIIGCDHIYQRKGQRCFGDERLLAFEIDQKRRFNDFISDQQALGNATLICEEIDHGCDTFAKDLAESRGATYANVDMPVQERERRGVPPGYADHDAPYTPEQVETWHSVREQFMVERLLAERQNPWEPALLICARLHRERIAAILRRRNVDIEVIDLADYDWFSDDWERDYPL